MLRKDEQRNCGFHTVTAVGEELSLTGVCGLWALLYVVETGEDPSLHPAMLFLLLHGAFPYLLPQALLAGLQAPLFDYFPTWWPYQPQ